MATGFLVAGPYDIVKSPDGNPVEIADAVRADLPTLVSLLPTGVSLTIISDDSEPIQGTVNDTLSNILMGIGLTALVLLLFLHDLRSTLIVALAMPMSIIPTFMVMSARGTCSAKTVNVISASPVAQLTDPSGRISPVPIW